MKNNQILTTKITKKSRITIDENGKRVGKYIIYYPNNKIKEINYFDDNGNLQQSEEYYENGKIKNKYNIKTHKMINYYDNGKIESEYYIINKKPNKQYKEYYPNGKLHIK